MKRVGLLLMVLVFFQACFTEEKSYFPFRVYDEGDKYYILADIEDAKLYSTYYNLFKKYGYVGNGECWTGHIIQILEKKDKSLLPYIHFDPEAGSFFAYTESKSYQIKFVEVLSPVFSDLNKLENYIKNADRSRIDD